MEFYNKACKGAAGQGEVIPSTTGKTKGLLDSAIKAGHTKDEF